MDPPAEYYGVEIPTRELARLVRAQRAFGALIWIILRPLDCGTA